MAFLTRRDDPDVDGVYRTHRWVADELAFAMGRNMKVVEVREKGVDDQGGLGGDRQLPIRGDGTGQAPGRARSDARSVDACGERRSPAASVRLRDGDPAVPGRTRDSGAPTGSRRGASSRSGGRPRFGRSRAGSSSGRRGSRPASSSGSASRRTGDAGSRTTNRLIRSASTWTGHSRGASHRAGLHVRGERLLDLVDLARRTGRRSRRGRPCRVLPAFLVPDPVRTVADRATRFRLDTAGWGTFTIHARVVGSDGQEQHMEHDLLLTYPDDAPAPA